MYTKNNMIRYQKKMISFLFQIIWKKLLLQKNGTNKLNIAIEYLSIKRIQSNFLKFSL